MTIDEIKKAIQEPPFDSSIVRHGFAPFLRDYDIVALINDYQYLYRFTHCVLAIVTTAVKDRLWKERETTSSRTTLPTSEPVLPKATYGESAIHSRIRARSTSKILLRTGLVEALG